MSSNTISNEQIYELLKEFKTDTNRQFDEVNRRLTRLEDRVDAVYESRDKVQVQFTRAWAGASVFIGFFAAFFAVIAAKVVIL